MQKYKNVIWWCWSYHARIGTQLGWCRQHYTQFWYKLFWQLWTELSCYLEYNEISFIEWSVKILIPDFIYQVLCFVLHGCINVFFKLIFKDFWQAQMHVYVTDLNLQIPCYEWFIMFSVFILGECSAKKPYVMLPGMGNLDLVQFKYLYI